MTVEVKRAWGMVVVSVIGYAAYLVVVLGRTGDGPLADVAYVGPLLVTVGGAIVVGIVLNIVVSVREPKGTKLKDQRDVEIGWFGDRIGQSFEVIGALTALVLAMAQAAHFWIANAIYLGFFLAAVVGSMAKIAAYRQGLR